MPAQSAGLRSRTSAALAGVIFEKETDPSLWRLIESVLPAAADGTLGRFEAATVRDAARSFRRRAALTKDIAQREAALGSDGFQAWVAAKSAKDFRLFAPVLTEWVALTKEKCAAIDPARPPYDVCLDTFERGMTSARLDRIFAEARPGAAKRGAPQGTAPHLISASESESA